MTLEDKMDRIKPSRIMKFAVTSLFILGIGIATCIDTAAQRRGRNWDGYPNWGGSFDLRQTALNAGFNEGSKEGSRDRSRNRVSNYSDFSAYRDANKDYSSRLGNRDLYQRYFRIAFEHGYDAENPNSNNSGNNRGRDWDRDRDRNRDWNRDRDGHRGRNWERYGNFGGSFQLRQTALNAGYNEGIKQGRDDRNRNRRRNYSDFSGYRNATTDYSSRLGDRELYRRYYREGFENGYIDGLDGN
jgi:hypothetical protein